MSILHSLSLANIDFEATKGVSFTHYIALLFVNKIQPTRDLSSIRTQLWAQYRYSREYCLQRLLQVMIPYSFLLSVLKSTITHQKTRITCSVNSKILCYAILQQRLEQCKGILKFSLPMIHWDMLDIRLPVWQTFVVAKRKIDLYHAFYQ